MSRQNYESVIPFINGLTRMQKFEIWWHYYYKMLCLKHDFYIGDVFENSAIYWGKPHLELPVLKVCLFKLWRNMHIHEYEEFISDKNIVVSDMGEDWKERGYAEKIRTEFHGIYDWYVKHQEDITIIA